MQEDHVQEDHVQEDHMGADSMEVGFAWERSEKEAARKLAGKSAGESAEKRGLIVSGGPLNLSFGAAFLKGKKYDYIIAVDAGVEACLKLGLKPDLLVGDFDTFGRERILEYQKSTGLPMKIHRPEKDESDTELAFLAAREAGLSRLHVIGATGGRLDHEISNFHLLYQAKKAGLTVELYDEKNRVRLFDAEQLSGEPVIFLRSEVYGKYVSFLPLTEEVKGITLRGFRYPLTKKDISISENPSLCVSNEVMDETAELTFHKGVLLCVESRD